MSSGKVSSELTVPANRHLYIRSVKKEMKCILILSDKGPMLKTLDYTIRIGSIPTFLYFDLFLLKLS